LAAYTITFAKAAARDLGKLPRAAQEQIRDRITELAKNPRPHGVESLQGKDKGLLRIRSGNYRVIYSVEDGALVVLVLRIADRKEAYR
jgi:mRNA interferase RelE/StbE